MIEVHYQHKGVKESHGLKAQVLKGKEKTSKSKSKGKKVHVGKWGYNTPRAKERPYK